MSAAEVIKRELGTVAGFHTTTEWSQRVLNALDRAGYAVVKLEDVDELRHGWCLEVRADGRIYDHGPIDTYSVADALGFSAALLAAAAEAASASSARWHTWRTSERG